MNLGPNISTDGLVLYLDVANVDSFRGEPTNNELPNFGTRGHNNTWSGSVTDRQVVTNFPSQFVGSFQVTRFISSGGTSLLKFFYGVPGFSGTENVNISFRVYNNNPTKNLVFLFNNVTQSNLTVPPLTYIEYSSSGSALSNNPQIQFRTVSLDDVIDCYVSDMQVEKKSYKTPFVNGNRGTTVATGGGVADISNNNNHAEFLASTSDSSNLGSIVFDGTDDYLAISDNTNTNLSTTDFTISFWIKAPNVSQSGPIIYKRRPQDPFDQYGVSIGDTGTDSGFTTLSSKKILVILRGDNSNQARIVTEEDLINSANGNWFKIDIVRFSNSLKIYYNGSEKKYYHKKNRRRWYFIKYFS